MSASRSIAINTAAVGIIGCRSHWNIIRDVSRNQRIVYPKNCPLIIGSRGDAAPAAVTFIVDDPAVVHRQIAVVRDINAAAAGLAEVAVDRTVDDLSQTLRVNTAAGIGEIA